MISSLALRLDNFPGAANQTRCFLHILNLTAKSILRQFEVQKKKSNEGQEDDDIDNDALTLLKAVTSEIEDDLPDEHPEEGDDECDDDDDDGLVDERQGMSEEEIVELEADLVPVRLMLAKVRE